MKIPPFLFPVINTYRENPKDTILQTHTGEHKMFDMSQLWALFRSLFTDQSYGQTIERYIVSRNPQTPADVERYTTEFQLKHGGGSWL